MEFETWQEIKFYRPKHTRSISDTVAPAFGQKRAKELYITAYSFPGSVIAGCQMVTTAPNLQTCA